MSLAAARCSLIAAAACCTVVASCRATEGLGELPGCKVLSVVQLLLHWARHLRNRNAADVRGRLQEGPAKQVRCDSAISRGVPSEAGW